MDRLGVLHSPKRPATAIPAQFRISTLLHKTFSLGHSRRAKSISMGETQRQCGKCDTAALTFALTIVI